MDDRRKSIGAKGERIAARRLKVLGYKIVEKNHRTRLGELDIIAEEGGDLVFVEVRTRTGNSFGTPEDSVTKRKQRKLTSLAYAYLERHDRNDVSCRFDVVAVEPARKWYKRHEVRVIQNAFQVD
ncbi:YraN family protein [Candidatus Hydrogenedentota bacterium]